MSTSKAVTSPGGADTGRMLARAAWLAVVLGIAMEIVALAVSSGFGLLKWAAPVLADLTQKISWSLFVCVGVAFGTALAKGRAAVAGWIGLLSGPLAFQGARVLHKAVSQALALPPASGGPSPLTVAILKGIEYGALGALLAWVGKSARRSPSDYLFAGLLTGVLAGGAIAIVFLSKAPAPVPAVAVVTRFANEVLHPVGCAFVVYAAENLSKGRSA